MRRIRDPAFPVQDIGGRQCIESSIQRRHRVIAKQDRVVNMTFLNERLNRFPSVFIHGNAYDSEALRLELLLKLDEPRNFYLARAAPSGPEIEQHHLTAKVPERDTFAAGIGECKIRRKLGILHKVGLVSSWTAAACGESNRRRGHRTDAVNTRFHSLSVYRKQAVRKDYGVTGKKATAHGTVFLAGSGGLGMKFPLFADEMGGAYVPEMVLDIGS